MSTRKKVWKLIVCTSYNVAIYALTRSSTWLYNRRLVCNITNNYSVQLCYTSFTLCACKQPLMMTYEKSESAQDNFGKFIYQFQPKTKTLIRKLERILIKLYRQKCLYYTIKHEGFLTTHTHTHTYIYVCIYIHIYHQHRQHHQVIFLAELPLTHRECTSLFGKNFRHHLVSAHSW